MTPRARILTALAHREPDRVPYDLGSFGPTGISIGAYQNLLAHLQSGEPAEVGDLSSQRARLSEEFLRAFRVDTRELRYRPQSTWKPVIREEGRYDIFFDEWGIGRKRVHPDGKNFFVSHHPLSGVATADLPRYSWPDPQDRERLNGLIERASELRKQIDPALVLGGAFSAGFLQSGTQMEGVEPFLMNLIREPARAEWLLDKILELKVNFYLWALEDLKDWVDVVMESDDFGYQESQWLSLPMFRKFIKPRYASLFSTLKKRFNVRILLHSCGAIYPFIPDMVEMGVDILNPIQLSAKGMGDTKKLKREFGEALTFWGGGIDIQQTLPSSTPQEIEDEVQRRIEDLAPGG